MLTALRAYSALILVVTLGLILGGCKDGTNSGTAAAADLSVALSEKPAISGRPEEMVMVDSTYRFRPTVTAAPGAALSFTIENQPEWSKFDSTTGMLSGSPTAANVGRYTQIIMSVTDGVSSSALAPFAIVVVAPSAAAASLASPIEAAAPVHLGAPIVASNPATATPSASSATPAASVAPATATTPAATVAPPTAAAPAPATPPATAAPTVLAISGSPQPTVVAGSAYSFRPTFSEPAGATVTFAISNLPAWATFNAATGTLSGSPAVANVGQSQQIVISVSDGSATAALAPFTISVTQPSSGVATLSWTAPTQNADGSPVTDLAGYHVYYGSSATALTNVVAVDNAAATSYVVNNLAPGTWYFAVTAFNSDNVESGLSATVPVTLAM